MKVQEDQNRRLKRMYAEESLISEVCKEALERKW
jgi:putative transposase